MKFKITFIVLFIINVFAVIYLLSPVPKVPDLPNSVKSNEPGDTIQIPNVSAYYTNQSREEIINFYKSNYNGLFRININHPPEKSRNVIRDTIQSYYLEEFILPFKESIFINGFEWEKDVFTKPEKRIKNKLVYQGTEYSTKVTIRTFPTSIIKRLITFFFMETVLILMLITYKSFVVQPKPKK